MTTSPPPRGRFLQISSWLSLPVAPGFVLELAYDSSGLFAATWRAGPWWRVAEIGRRDALPRGRRALVSPARRNWLHGRSVPSIRGDLLWAARRPGGRMPPDRSGEFTGGEAMRTFLTRPHLYLLPPPIDEIALANALVLKDPPLDLIGRENMPNFIRCLHHDLRQNLGSKVLLPNLHLSQFVGIFSDYGGDEPDSDYHTYSFLFISLDSATACHKLIQEIRAQHKLLLPYREMAFKNLSYGQLERALPQWLDAIDHVPGLLFSLMVDKRAKSVVTRNTDEDLRALANDMQAKNRGVWRKKHLAERFMRIAHCVAYWCSLLCRQDQQVIWISDNDSVIEHSLIEPMKQVVMSAAAEYRPDLHLTLSLGRESQVPVDFAGLREFLSYPDLSAGALANALTSAIARKVNTKLKAVPIVRWHAWQRIGLKKALFLCSPEGTKISGAFGTMEHDVIPDDVRFIPVTGNGTSVPSQPIAVQCKPGAQRS